jgi:hypothetical protein
MMVRTCHDGVTIENGENTIDGGRTVGGCGGQRIKEGDQKARSEKTHRQVHYVGNPSGYPSTRAMEVVSPAVEAFKGARLVRQIGGKPQ